MKHRFLVYLSALTLAFSCTSGLRDGEYCLTVLSTNDVHSCWFDSTYVGGGVKKSLFAVNYYVDSVRRADGASNVLLVDAGDCLQGDNSAYYFNYVDTLAPHLFPRLMGYMKYDAVAVGNHDIETGHPVYDRVTPQLHKAGADFLAGNAIRNDGGGTYFPLYKMVKKAGLRIAVLGYTNANIKAWLGEEIWSGMHFESIAAIIQADVDKVRGKENPDVLVVTMHSSCGKGDGTVLEGEALDCINSVKGVDWLIFGHDHIPFVQTRDTCALLNSGSHCRFLAHGKMNITVKDGAVVSKTFSTDLIPVDETKADPRMRDTFRKEFEAVREFTTREVGVLTEDIRTRDSYAGECAYMSVLHALTLSVPGVQVSIAAPLSFDREVKAGTLIFNDLFTIYPFENQLYVLGMTGEELRRYLEVSYDRWIQAGPEHVLRIVRKPNLRTGAMKWSLEGTFFNFDSAGGINYTVDVEKPFGSRVKISSMADGTPFSLSQAYNVGMTSYRASGGGNLLAESGIAPESVDSRIVARHQEIRNILYDYLKENGSLDPQTMASAIGEWQFVPEKARKTIAADMALMFD